MISNLRNYCFRYVTLISSKKVIISNLSSIFVLIDIFEGFHYRKLLKLEIRLVVVLAIKRYLIFELNFFFISFHVRAIQFLFLLQKEYSKFYRVFQNKISVKLC